MLVQENWCSVCMHAVPQVSGGLYVLTERVSREGQVHAVRHRKREAKWPEAAESPECAAPSSLCL